MEGIKLRNKEKDTIVIVSNGKVYDATTMIQLPENHPETKKALEYIETQLNAIWDRMGEIDAVWGDAEEYQRLEKIWLKHLDALYA